MEAFMENVNNTSTSIKKWATGDRPREKLLDKGAETLSDAELIAILLNNGTKSKSAVELARDLLSACNNSLHDLGKRSLADLKKIKGIGTAKSVSIIAALELGRRREGLLPAGKTVVRSSGEIAGYLKSTLRDLSYEVFAVLYLNRSNKILRFEIISRGGITGTVADPRVILKRALEEGATSIILCHNHPSGGLRPSLADEELTRKIKHAAAYIDIRVIDHIIVSDEGYYSFADDGIL
ncbi:MAG TPA: DNA repair protein RadC [Ferruginibacter sp.]|nr:DNA repair protein RadC [Ferruginibacter sp.]HNP00293.1 DNA repair protein RadC [Ferruginibacter sp.]